jgi:hypothetical protein
MTQFRLSEVAVRWSGTDDNTPDGHCIATGKDTLGNHRVWLFTGDEPSDDGYRGNILVPASAGVILTAYGPTNAYVASGWDEAKLLNRLAKG